MNRLTVLGAHPDDIEIGAGGTLLRLAAATPGLRVHYVLLTGAEERVEEARGAARGFLPDAEVTFEAHQLPDGRLPAYWGEAKQILQDAAASFDPELVLAPALDDAHQDHRTLAELVATAYRDHLCLRYEIPKWDGDLGRRQLYVPLTEELMRRKVELLHASYPSQKSRDWWDDELFTGLARVRGVECRSRYAEAYSISKAVVDL
ncbi:MAG: PIG-L deacetylase family protein [Micromonosporaceae bacterium]